MEGVMPSGIMGIGIDIVDVRRIAALWERHPDRFVHRLLSDAEQAHLETLTVIRLAGRWAAKEAVSKAMGSGFTGFGLSDIEIFNTALGMPYVRLRPAAACVAAQRGIGSFLLTISHEREMAIAQAMAFPLDRMVDKVELTS